MLLLGEAPEDVCIATIAGAPVDHLANVGGEVLAEVWAISRSSASKTVARK
jgi:hypothetical protein